MTEATELHDIVRVPATPEVLRYEKNFSSLCDVQNLDLRTEVIHYVLEEACKSTEGAFDPETLKKTKRLLDLGMGRGAVGAVAKAMNPEIEIVGIDFTEYQGDTAYDMYNQRIIGSLLEPKVWETLKSQGAKFDAIMSVGLPIHVLEFLLEGNNIADVMDEKGQATIFTDMPVSVPERSPWKQYHGKMIIDNAIFIRK